MVLFLAAAAWVTHGQQFRTMDYVINQGGKMFMMTNGQSLLLAGEVALPPDIKIQTNGVVTIAGVKATTMPPGRKVTLDGFWINDDGLLIYFKPHYLFKDRGLYWVKDGVLSRLDQAVTFPNGAVLNTEGKLLTSSQQLVRLQDGQALTPDCRPVPALDHAMVSNGRFILQKDGSIIPLGSESTIGMTDGTRIMGKGLIIPPGGQPIQLKEGQRLVLEGPVMPPIH